MKKNKAFKFRLYPNKEQAIQLGKNFGCCRFVFNYFLGLSKDTYEKENRTLKYNDYARMLVELKKEKEFLKEVDSISLQQALRHLDTSYKNFFNNNGYPKFKKKSDHHDSYSTVNVNNNIMIIDEKHIKLPKLGIVRCKIHRDIPNHYILKSVTLIKNPSNKYYVSILYEHEEIELSRDIDLYESVGLDYSMKQFFVSSGLDSIDEEYMRLYKKGLDRLRFLQKTLSRRQGPNHKKNIESSHRYEKQRIKVAKYHEYLKNKRKDYYNKLANEIANRYDVVAIEDLNMQDMANEYKRNGKVVYDNAWGEFTKILDEKLRYYDKRLIKVSKYYPSSKMCSKCKYKNENLTIEMRTWVCPKCGRTHDRDINASINIRNEGLRILTRV